MNPIAVIMNKDVTTESEEKGILQVIFDLILF